jgi:transposase
MKYCGIDLASKASAVCVMDAQQKIEIETEVPTDDDGFRLALRGYEELTCVIEASPLAEWVARVLEGLGHRVIVIDPRKAKAVIATKNKTDKLDARNLARMAATGWYNAVHRKSEEARLLRSFLKARTGLVDTQRQQSNRIRGLLRAHGMRVGQVAQGRFVERVHECLERDCPELLPAIQPLLDSWVSLRHDIAKLTKHLRRLARQDETCALLMTAPGVGPLVASAYVATIDDPRRFARSDQVPAYVGLVPSVHQSSDTIIRGPITKEGDALLRWLLVEASHVLLNLTHADSKLKRWGKRLQKRKGSAKAKVAVARKLAMILHRMWLTNTPFRAEMAT